MKKFCIFSLIIILFTIPAILISQEKKKEKEKKEENQFKVKKTYIQDIPLINNSDYYTGLYLNLRESVGEIIGSEDNLVKRNTFSINEVLVAKFKDSKIEKGDKFEVIQPVTKRGSYYNKSLIRKVGVVMVIAKDEQIAKVRIIELSEDVTIGSKLIPYKEIKPYRGEKPQDINIIKTNSFKETGKILYIQDNIDEAPEGSKLIINAGKNKNLKRGTHIYFSK